MGLPFLEQMTKYCFKIVLLLALQLQNTPLPTMFHKKNPNSRLIKKFLFYDSYFNTIIYQVYGIEEMSKANSR